MGTDAPGDIVAPAEDEDERQERVLVDQAKGGDATALERLVRRHQAFVFNLAVRMLYCPQDAEDATQEILIKVVTKLSTFEGRSRFRTWLYRIATNHLLNMKRGRSEPEAMTFSDYGRGLDAFMQDKCGLMNPANACRCAKKARSFMRKGYIDPKSLLFARERVRLVREVAPARCDAIDGYQDFAAEIYRSHLFYEPSDLALHVRQVVEDPAFRRTFEL
jgi:RNA polymerase sigma factor (sigma-70 family)